MKEIVLDTETTGISVKEGHRVVEIGCVELDNLIPTGKKFHCYLNPERKVSEKAFEVHGYTDEFLSNQKKFSEIGDEFLEFIKDKKLIIHNAEFDLGHLNNELSLLGRPNLSNTVIDTVSLARRTLNTRVANLDYLCRRFKVDLSERDLHGALLDSRLLAEVYLELKGGKQFSMNLSKNNTETNKQKNTNKNKMKTVTSFIPLEADIALHKEMVNEIKQPIWKKYNY